MFLFLQSEYSQLCKTDTLSWPLPLFTLCYKTEINNRRKLRVDFHAYERRNYVHK